MKTRKESVKIATNTGRYTYKRSDTLKEQGYKNLKENDKIDLMYGFERVTDTKMRTVLELANHLIGKKLRVIKLTFPNLTPLTKVRKELTMAVKRNSESVKDNSLYMSLLSKSLVYDDLQTRAKFTDNPMDKIVDIKEADVPYHCRVSIDLKIFSGTWYDSSQIKLYGTSFVYHATGSY